MRFALWKCSENRTKQVFACTPKRRRLSTLQLQLATLDDGSLTQHSCVIISRARIPFSVPSPLYQRVSRTNPPHTVPDISLDQVIDCDNGFSRLRRIPIGQPRGLRDLQGRIISALWVEHGCRSDAAARVRLRASSFKVNVWQSFLSAEDEHGLVPHRPCAVGFVLHYRHGVRGQGRG